MFRKIITELAYSPALAGNLGYYVKQLRDETSKRQIGLVFVILAITIQLFTALSPPESANAHDPDIFIDGGIQSIDEYLSYYDQNTANIKDLLNSLGVARSEIEVAKLAGISSLATMYSWSPQNSREMGGVYFYTTYNTTPGIAYYRTFVPRSSSSSAYVGLSSVLGGKFAITQDGATLLTEKKPASACANWIISPNTPLRIDSWASDDPACSSILETSVSAREISTNSPTIEKFRASDRIAYTLTMKNSSDKPISITPSLNLEDTLEYSRILDYGGGEYNFDTRNISWLTTQIEAESTLERTFITQILPTIPATAKGEYISRSYDCTVTISFGNTLSTPVDCPLAKSVEQLTSSLPSVPAKVNIIVPFSLLIISLFFYLRSRQLLTELYIIRHNHLGGL